jgi:protein-S-isoprenylcysteine O-methyltransferase Ste14
MFLPSEVIRSILEFEYVDSLGISRPLVSGVEAMYLARGRPGVLDIPRKQWPMVFVFSLLLCLFLCFLFYKQSKSPAVGQVALGICHSLFGFVFGGAGLLLFFMSNFTAHDYTFNNANLIFCNPLLLAAIPLGIRYASSPTYDKRLRAECTLRLLWLLVALGIFVSMLIKLLPQFWQQNLADQLLMLPIALTFALEPAGLRRMLQRIFWRWL